MKLKKPILAVIITIFCVSTLPKSCFAQKKNIVKAGLLGLPFKSFSVGYERILSPKTSVALSASFMPERILPARLVEESDDLFGGRFSGVSLTPEFRLYSKKKEAPAGGYLAPYLRYTNYKSDLSGIIEDELAAVNANLTSFGLGIQFGTQWTIKDLITIDWYFLGISVNRYNVRTDIILLSSQTGFEDYREDLEASLQDIPIIGANAEVTVDESTIKVSAPFIFLGLRSGLAVGVWF